jgi:hypothetical protein
MRNFRLMAAGAALAGVFALAACGGGGGKNANTNTGNKETSGTQVKQVNPAHVAHNAMSGTVLNINMGAMNGSKQDGSASVTDKGNGVEVLVKLSNEPKGASEPEHIHKGTCKNLDPVPWKPLENVVDGKATTMVPGVTVAELKKGTYAINVHKSANDLKTYVSCGDLKV